MEKTKQKIENILMIAISAILLTDSLDELAFETARIEKNYRMNQTKRMKFDELDHLIKTMLREAIGLELKFTDRFIFYGNRRFVQYIFTKLGDSKDLYTLSFNGRYEAILVLKAYFIKRLEKTKVKYAVTIPNLVVLDQLTFTFDKEDVPIALDIFKDFEEQYVQYIPMLCKPSVFDKELYGVIGLKSHKGKDLFEIDFSTISKMKIFLQKVAQIIREIDGNDLDDFNNLKKLNSYMYKKSFMDKLYK